MHFVYEEVLVPLVVEVVAAAAAVVVVDVVGEVVGVDAVDRVAFPLLSYIQKEFELKSRHLFVCLL